MTFEEWKEEVVVWLTKLSSLDIQEAYQYVEDGTWLRLFYDRGGSPEEAVRSDLFAPGWEEDE